MRQELVIQKKSLLINFFELCVPLAAKLGQARLTTMLHYPQLRKPYFPLSISFIELNSQIIDRYVTFSLIHSKGKLRRFHVLLIP